MRRLLCVAAAGVSLLVPSSTAAHRLARTATTPLPTASAAAIADANELIREPWGPLVPTITAQAKTALANLDGDFMHGSGKVGNAKWSFGLGLSNLRPGNFSMTNPPGFTSAGPDGFSVRAPLSGSWSLGLAGTFNAHVDASAFGHKLVGGNLDIPFALSFSKLAIAATANLDSSDPARPKLRSAAIDAHLQLGGAAFAPQPAVDVNLTRRSDGLMDATVALAKASIRIAGMNAGVETSLTIRLLPFSTDFASNLAVPGVDLSASGAFVYALVYLGGKLTFPFPSPLHSITAPMPLSLLGEYAVPVPAGVAELLRFASRGAIPAVWPTLRSSNPLGVAPAPPASLDFSGVRDTLERGIAARHMPYGAVLSIDTPPARSGRTGSAYTYGLEADSSIWTGHYLAAEAFRYAATHSPEALQRVHTLVDAIARDFAQTSDAVVTGPSKYAAVDPSIAGNVFSRNVIPASDPHGWTKSAKSRIGKQCLYVTSTQGWKAGKVTYPTYARAAKAAGRSVGLVQPVAPIYGTGCGSTDADNPVSRDQYSGIFMGLAYASMLVPDVRQQVKALVDKSLGFLLDQRHPWDVPLPPDNLSRTSFLGGFDAQIDLLRIGATIDPAKFGDRYDTVKAASALAWIPVWFSTIDPVTGYFKFNLDHAFLGPALFLESDSETKQNLLAAYAIIRKATATHRNAWFDTVDILTGTSSASSSSASNPTLTLGDEIKSDLNDWATRWTYVKNSNGDGMPTNLTSTSAANALAGLWPGDVAQYSSALGAKGILTVFPLPVYDRVGDGMDFVWQRSPFGAGVDAKGGRKVNGMDCGATPPSAPEVAACSSATPMREGPGVDFLLPYWLARYLGVLSG